jgi:hypothetical protein
VLGSVLLLDSKSTPRKVPCSVRGRTEKCRRRTR